MKPAYQPMPEPEPVFPYRVACFSSSCIIIRLTVLMTDRSNGRLSSYSCLRKWTCSTGEIFNELLNQNDRFRLICLRSHNEWLSPNDSCVLLRCHAPWLDSTRRLNLSTRAQCMILIPVINLSFPPSQYLMSYSSLTAPVWSPMRAFATLNVDCGAKRLFALFVIHPWRFFFLLLESQMCLPGLS